jgi:hypothetical protein
MFKVEIVAGTVAQEKVGNLFLRRFRIMSVDSRPYF